MLRSGLEVTASLLVGRVQFCCCQRRCSYSSARCLMLVCYFTDRINHGSSALSLCAFLSYLILRESPSSIRELP